MKKFWFSKIVYPYARFYWKWFRPKTRGVRAILECGGDLLLVKHAARDHWSLPGGGVKKSEDSFLGLLRELREELGILPGRILNHRLLGTYQNNREGKIDTVEIFVLACEGREFVQGYELDDAQWFLLDALPETVSPATLRRVREYQGGEWETAGEW